MAKITNKTIPVEATITTLKGVMTIIELLRTANNVFDRAGFESPYKMNDNDLGLLAFGMALFDGSIDNYRHDGISDEVIKPFKPLVEWVNEEGNSGVTKVFTSFVDTDKVAVKFVYTANKFGVAISRGYLLDLVARYNNLEQEHNKKTENRNDWRRNLRVESSWFVPRILDVANALRELDTNIAESNITFFDRTLFKNRAGRGYSYYSRGTDYLTSPQSNPYLSQRYEQETVKNILMGTYGEHYKESDLSNIKRGSLDYREKGFPLPVAQAELIYSRNYNSKLKGVETNA
jgi:hypothetical protein